MSLSAILDIGKSALLASQTQLNVTSNNISNATTPGYSRQEVVLEIATPIKQALGYIGRGVSISEIKRQYNGLLQNQINTAQQDYGKSSTLSQTLNNIEQIFNEAQGTGLATPLADFFNAWQGVVTNPQGLTERNLLLQKANTLVNSVQGMEEGITNTFRYTQAGIAQFTGQVNSLASQIARLNVQITQAEASSTGATANDLRDQRDAALKDLSNLIELSSWEDKNTGALTVSVGMKTLVDGNSTKTLSAGYDQTGDFTLQLAGEDITARITKGEIGGLLTAQEDIEDNLHDLRKLVASLTNTVNLQHAQGFGLDGSSGSDFFNPVQLSTTNDSAGATLTASITDNSQLTMDEYIVRFNAGNYEIYDKATGSLKTSGVYVSGANIDIQDQSNNPEGIRLVITGALTDQDSFTISPLTGAIQNFGTAITSAQKIAASGTAAGLPGDNTNALALAGLIDSRNTALGSATFSSYYQNLVGRVGTQSRTASDQLNFSETFLTQLTNQRDAVSGVNMDEEAANLIRFQRSYEAAARLIKTADDILQTLLQI